LTPDPATVNEAARGSLINSFKAGYPDLLPRQSADLMLDVIDRVTLKDSGRFISQYGNKRWLKLIFVLLAGKSCVISLNLDVHLEPEALKVRLVAPERDVL